MKTELQREKKEIFFHNLEKIRFDISCEASVFPSRRFSSSNSCTLILTKLWTISADEKLITFFLFFLENRI